jgi:hypothetical protein
MIDALAFALGGGPSLPCAEDAQRDETQDFGKTVLPRLISRYDVQAYNFNDENRKAPYYWREVGTIDAYWEANADRIAVELLFNLYDQVWPLQTYQVARPSGQICMGRGTARWTARHGRQFHRVFRLHHQRRSSISLRVLPQRPGAQLRRGAGCHPLRWRRNRPWGSGAAGDHR